MKFSQQTQHKIGFYLKTGEEEFQRAVISGNPEQLVKALELTTKGIKIFVDVENLVDVTEYFEFNFLCNLSGRIKSSLNDIEPNLGILSQGLEELKIAADYGERYPEIDQKAHFRTHYYVTLVQFATDMADVPLLRLAAKEILDLVECCSLEDWPVESSSLLNAFALANLRVGTHTNDRKMVSDIVVMLQLFGNKKELSEIDKISTLKNFFAAAIEHARQTRSPRVYQTIVEKSDESIGRFPQEEKFFRYQRAQARLELGEILNDLAILQDSLGDFEELLEDDEKNMPRSPHAVRVVMAIGQIKFGLGRREKKLELVSQAVSHFSAVYDTVEEREKKVSVGIVRILLNRVDANVWLLENGEGCSSSKSVEKDLLRAREQVRIESSPDLFAEVSTRLFKFFYSQELFDKALSFFEDVTMSWSYLLSDPHVSAEVYRQKAQKLEGLFDMAAVCSVKVNDIGRAFSYSNHGRAQVLRNMNFISRNAGNLSPERLAQIDDVEKKWKFSRFSDSENECYTAWINYISVLKNLGLYEQEGFLSQESILEKVPKNGAVITIFRVGVEMFVIIVKRELPFFDLLKIDKFSLGRILILSLGSETVASWFDFYDLFRNGSKSISEEEKIKYWDGCVTSSCESIAESLMIPICEALKKFGVEEGAEVVIMPSGELASFPLAQVFVDEENTFSDLWPTSLVPCLELLNRPCSEIRNVEQNVTIVAHSEETFLVSDSLEDELFFASKEAKAISCSLACFSSVSVLGRETSSEEVMSGLQNSELIHVSSHGRYDWENVLRTSIDLPNGDKFRLSAFNAERGGRFRARLVFLSCCESAIFSQTVPADEFQGVLPNLLSCGVSAAIGSLWPVFDDAAYLISVKFYRLLGEKGGELGFLPSLLLSEAQKWLRNVTIGELIHDGFFDENVAANLFEERLAHSRLRLDGKALRGRNDVNSLEVPGVRSFEEFRSTRLYSSPVDWAAFVVIGC